MRCLRTFIVLLLATVSVLPAQATLVVFEWTPTQIFLAADSLGNNFDFKTMTSEGVIQCKIHQVGNIFFAIIGANARVVRRSVTESAQLPRPQEFEDDGVSDRVLISRNSA